MALVWSPYWFPAWEGDVEAIEELVRRGANVDARGPHGTQPVLIAVSRYHNVFPNPRLIPGIKTLVAVGANKPSWITPEEIPSEEETVEIRWRVFFRESFVQKLLREIK